MMIVAAVLAHFEGKAECQRDWSNFRAVAKELTGVVPEQPRMKTAG